jgi:hypothetical protein
MVWKGLTCFGKGSRFGTDIFGKDRQVWKGLTWFGKERQIWKGLIWLGKERQVWNRLALF